MSIKLGEYNTLELNRKTINGFYLSDGETEVLLPNKYVTPEMKNGEDVEVFVYKDSEDRLVATTEKPMATIHEMAPLKAVSVTSYGVFFDWGLDKDLFVPLSNLKTQPDIGERKLIYIYEDIQTERLVGTEKVEKFLDQEEMYLAPKESVKLIPIRQTPLGYEVLINNSYIGLLHNSDAWMPIELFEEYDGFVKFIREDYKIDVVLGDRGFQKIDKTEKVVMDKLGAENGFLPFNDKSSPDDIRDNFEMSKKTFKTTIGTLYKKKLIRIESDGIYIV